MQEFLGKLWQNPNLQKTPIDKKENQVLSFLKENQGQLQKVFAQEEYFPHLNWNDTLRLLLSEMVDKLLETISPNIDHIKKHTLLPAVLESFDNKCRIEEDSFKNFLIEMFRNKVMRDQILSSIQMISLGYFDNYVPVALDNRKYLYNEIYRRDRIKMDLPHIPKYLGLVAIFRSLFYLPIKYRAGSDETLTLAKAIRDKKLYDTLIGSMEEYLNSTLGTVPREIWLSGVESNMNLSDFPSISGASKFIAVIAARSADYVPMDKQDRGADTPDKSWFQINRRNAKMYGIDPDMMDELYQIAGNKGW